ncbi:DUF1249 domain-containing protein [Congregibacter brevis]|uniref:DUF1249 domain-containing protein n=1 Tax=Congregibacter brevis TaxID=3081201 RepID=A0ABZ0IEA8_9GAMM|nr:DUF1249 domain-containing protein [Congregibacter sp. IMCC45268]
MIKGSYKVDLRALHALCEANYARLLRLFSDYESCNSKHFSVDGAQVHIEVLERSRYTTLFCLQSYRSAAMDSEQTADLSTNWLAPLVMEARAYHDAGMIEVVRFQTAGKTQGRYTYPNPSMHQQDEKNQQNRFLADWLSHCLHFGQADVAGLLKPGAEHA